VRKFKENAEITEINHVNIERRDSTDGRK